MALFGGFIGLHKFYLNDPGSGIFYAILGIMSKNLLSIPISTMLGVIDAIRLFSMSTEAFDNKYNKGKSTRRRQQRTIKAKNQRSRSRSRQDMEMERERYKYKKDILSKHKSNPFVKSANTKFKEYDLEGALEDYKQAMTISPPTKEMYFNLACIYSLMEETDKSLVNLELAIDNGYKDLQNLGKVDELAFLRIQPEYEAFVINGHKRVMKGKTIEPPAGDLLQDDLLLSQLNKLKELRTKGMLSEKEFVQEKEKLMRR